MNDTPEDFMGKGDRWYEPFEFKDWTADPALQRCSLAARGLWIELLCFMWASRERSGQVTGTYGDIARIARCTESEATALLKELAEKDAADLSERNGQVTVTCRRMAREHERRKRDADRKRRERDSARPKPSESIPGDVHDRNSAQIMDLDETSELCPRHSHSHSQITPKPPAGDSASDGSETLVDWEHTDPDPEAVHRARTEQRVKNWLQSNMPPPRRADIRDLTELALLLGFDDVTKRLTRLLADRTVNGPVAYLKRQVQAETWNRQQQIDDARKRAATPTKRVYHT